MKQRKIISIGAFVLIVCCLFPPWVYTVKHRDIYSEESAGYSLILSPPEKKGDSAANGVKLDVTRILLQIFMISVATSVSVLLLSSSKPTESDE